MARRRLQIPVAGRWYFGLMVMLGGVSLVSSNNVVYLMESLLISALLFSAMISAKTVHTVRVEVRRRPIRAQGENHDVIFVTNNSRFPIFCLEVEEWFQGKPRRLAFIPYLRGRSSVSVSATAVYERRGSWTWDSVGVSTMYPYGFLRFIERVHAPGSRIVWPASVSGANREKSHSDSQARGHAGTSILEGEVRPMNYDDDPRSIVWTLSARGGEPMVRVRSGEKQHAGLSLDLRVGASDNFETSVSALAGQLYELSPSESDGVALTLTDWEGKRRVHGRARVLDCLATIQPCGSRSA